MQGDEAGGYAAGRRPAVHLTAERGWVNDPLAPTWDGERYHLFFQYVPDSTQWQTGCHWGHAVSDDLLHWRELDVALAPGDGDDGVWSGSLVRHGTGWRIFSTSVDAADQQLGRVRWADSPTLDGPWTKGDVVATAPPGLAVTAFRDPFVVRVDGAEDEHGGWRMLVGLSLDHDVAAVATWTSHDLSHWTYDGLAASRPSSETDPVWTGSLWECPQLVEVGGRRHLMVSAWHDGQLHHVAAAPTGPDPADLTPGRWQQLTCGAGYYAPATFVDADGEPGLVFWMRGLHDAEAVRAGALSVPHRLRLDADRLVLRLHPAVTSAARTRREGSNAALAEPVDLSAGPFRARVGGVPVLVVSHQDGRVLVDADGTRESVEAPPTEVQVLLDGPCIEVVTLGGAIAHTLPGPTWWDDEAEGATLRWLP